MTTDSIIPILYLLGAAQGAFLALALLTNKLGNHRANSYLAGLTLVFVVALLDYFFDSTGLTERYVFIRVLLWPKEFLYGLLIYFYTREMIEPGRYLMHGRQLWHLVPVVVHVLVTWPLLFVSPQRQQHILSNDFGHGDEIWTFVLGDFELALTMAQITIYILLSLRLLALHKQRLMANYSDIERISLDWLRNLLLGILMVYFIWILEELVSDDLYQGELLDAMLGLSMVVLIYAMGYLGLRQPAIFTGRIRRPDGVVDIASDETPVPTTVVSAEPEDCIEPGGKYQNSSLSAEMGAALLAELEQYMQTHKPYLDSSLSLPQLAEALSVSVNYLSQVINEHGQLNFFDYVNGYRVKEIIALMQSPEGTDRNLLELGLQAGFNSKSAFYAAFKKHQDMTPGQYRKQLVATT